MPGRQTIKLVYAANDEYNIKTCQSTIFSHLKRTVGEACDDKLFECETGLQCSSGKCAMPNSTSPDPTPSGCVTIKKVTTAETVCITNAAEIEKIGKTFETKESPTGETISYTHLSYVDSAASCKKLNLEETGNNSG